MLGRVGFAARPGALPATCRHDENDMGVMVVSWELDIERRG